MTDVTPHPPPPPYPPPPNASGPSAHRPRVSAVPAVDDPAPRRLVVFALGTALLLETGLRGGADNLVVTAAVVLAVVALLADGRLQRTEARWLAVVALVPAAFLAVRASPWLMWSNLAIVAAFLSAAVLYSRSGSVFDASPGQLAQRVEAAAGRAIGGQVAVTALVPRLSPGDQRRAVRIGTALAVSVPVLAVLVALLASADAVFASLLTPDADLGPLGGHLGLTLLLAPLMLGLAGAATGVLDNDRRWAGGFGVAEVATMLGLAALVLGLFAVSQLVALTGAGDRLVSEAGLTPAEYARGGFFQLCWATGVVLGFLGVVRALAAPDTLGHRAVRILGAAVPALALGLVAVSLRRMALYDDVFGLTMLRLWVVLAAVWMGCVLVMTAVRNAGRSGGRWLVAGAGIAALVLVLAADVANPEAFVVRHNGDRARDGADLDIEYVVGLSADAVPAIADDPLMARYLYCTVDPQGVTALNLAEARAADRRKDACFAG